MAIPSVSELKKNLILEGNSDDAFLSTLIDAAISYSEAYQHLADGYYTTTPEGAEQPPEMPARTKQAVIMLATHWYESRDGGTGGFFADSHLVATQIETAVNNLLRLDRDWKV